MRVLVNAKYLNAIKGAHTIQVTAELLDSRRRSRWSAILGGSAQQNLPADVISSNRPTVHRGTQKLLADPARHARRLSAPAQQLFAETGSASL